MSNFPEVFGEAAAALDLFPVSHAQFVQQRLRAGLINGACYIDSNRHECKTCFYGALCLAEGLFTDEYLSVEEENNAYVIAFNFSAGIKGLLLSPFERWLHPYLDEGTGIGGQTPENHPDAKLFDDFLSAYITERQLRDAEVTCELLPVEEMVAL